MHPQRSLVYFSCLAWTLGVYDTMLHILRDTSRYMLVTGKYARRSAYLVQLIALIGLVQGVIVSHNFVLVKVTTLPSLVAR